MIPLYIASYIMIISLIAFKIGRKKYDAEFKNGLIIANRNIKAGELITVKF